VAADNLIQRCIEHEKNKRAQFYTAHSIKEEPENRDRVEDKRACIYRERADKSSTKDRTFLFIRASVSRAIKAEAIPALKVRGLPESEVEVQGRFDPTSFLSFAA
jgi:hypothetical protein